MCGLNIGQLERSSTEVSSDRWLSVCTQAGAGVNTNFGDFDQTSEGFGSANGEPGGYARVPIGGIVAITRIVGHTALWKSPS